VKSHITHHPDSWYSALHHLLTKNLSGLFNKIENRKFEVRLFSFFISITAGSIAISLATFIQNYFLLGLNLFLIIVTLSLCLAQIMIKLSFIAGLLSFIVSVFTIVYGLTMHADLF
jgi:hypothetical protein